MKILLENTNVYNAVKENECLEKIPLVHVTGTNPSAVKIWNGSNYLGLISKNWKLFRVEFVGVRNKQIMSVIKPLHALIFFIEPILHSSD